MDDSYRRAEHELREILKAKEFQPPSRQDPWWHPIWSWVRAQVHLTFSQGNWRTMAWIIGIVVVLLFLVALIWWLVFALRARKVKAARVSMTSTAGGSKFELAQAAYTEGRYAAMIHWLVEACLQSAAHRGWIRYVPYKTARAYRRDIEQVADAEFVQVFRRLVAVAEAVLFANQPLTADDAANLLDHVRTLEQGVVK